MTATTPGRVHHATRDQMIAGLPSGTTIIGEGLVPAAGDGTLFLIFPSPAQRAAYRAAYHGAWMTISDRSLRLDYASEWDDTQGAGLTLGQYAGPGTQARAIRDAEQVVR